MCAFVERERGLISLSLRILTEREIEDLSLSLHKSSQRKREVPSLKFKRLFLSQRRFSHIESED